MRRRQLRQRFLGLSMLALSLVGCGGVVITPDPVLPRALIEPIPAKVGLLLTAEQRSFVHSETRNGVTWEVALGAGQQRLVRMMFSSIFGESRDYKRSLSRRLSSTLSRQLKRRAASMLLSAFVIESMSERLTASVMTL
jgi:uncharacterized lipoprotein YmbA